MVAHRLCCRLSSPRVLCSKLWQRRGRRAGRAPSRRVTPPSPGHDQLGRSGRYLIVRHRGGCRLSEVDAAWAALNAAAERAKVRRIASLFDVEPGRLGRLTVEAAGLTL